MGPVFIIITILASIVVLFLAFMIVFMIYGIGRNDKHGGFYYDREYVENSDWLPKEHFETIIRGSTWIRDAEAEDIYITSFDGLKLHGRLICPPDPKASILMCHGYRSSGYNDFPDYAEFIYNKGYRLLIIDQRATQKSEGKFIGMGVLERYDCLKWAELLASRFPGEPLFLEGVSMGAATVLMATGLDLPKEVRGVIADCGFTSPREIFGTVFKARFHLPKEPFMTVMTALIKIFAKYDCNYSAEDALKDNKLPVLFIHGEADDFVPHYMSEKNVAAAKNCYTKFISVPGAAHAQSYLIDTERCRKEAVEFLETFGKTEETDK
ncbi:MAG: alpha/beta hydrolase [Clostridia bacterium]|nr:alpha/beta hydrolase [Clostridia bacterium]